MKLSIKGRLSAAAKILATGYLPDDHRAAFLRGDDVETDFNSEVALKYSAVFGCCRVLAETFASVPVILYKKDGKERIPIMELEKADPEAKMLYDVLHMQPNDEMSPFNCKESMMMSLCLGGNAVCERLVNAKDQLVGLYPYQHSVVKIDRDKQTKKLIYQIGSGADGKALDRSRVLHIPGPSLDGVKGVSPFTYAAQAIQLGLSYEKFGVNFYRNSANPSGVFECPNALSGEAYERLKDGLKENYTGLTNTGTPMLLEEGMKWAQMTINPVDAQLLESKNFQIEDICRIYRVPQHLVNKLDRSTNNNIEHQSLEFVMYTMLPWFKRTEECYNAQIVPRRLRLDGYFFESKMDGLLRGDSTARAALYANGRQWGWLSANDIRKLENLPAIPNGDIYLSPGNMLRAGTENANAVSNKTLDEIYNILKEGGKA
jgi:HK97 family phage portal protein